METPWYPEDIIGRTRRGAVKRKGSFLTRQREKLRLQRRTRLQKLLENLAVSMNPRFYMNELIRALEESDSIHKPEIISYPRPGDTFTFVYEARTPGLIYDYHPLSTIIAFTDNGFIGYNHHLGEQRNYRVDDGRVLSDFYKVYQDELQDAVLVPSQFMRIAY
jgi:hypothetical protein